MSAFADEDISVQENLLARLDRVPVNRQIFLIMIVLGIVWICEAFDIGIIAPVLSLVKGTWHLQPHDVGLVGSAGTFGIVLGLLPAGRLADRFGRKTTLLGGIVIFSVFTFVASFSHNVTELVICRFLAGVGQGAVFPVPYLMMSEFVNKKWRGTVIALCNSTLGFAYGLNTLAAALIIGHIPDDQAWRLLLVIGGGTILILPLVMALLPESPRFLLKAGRVDKVRKFVEGLENISGLPHDETLFNPSASRVLEAKVKVSLWDFLHPAYFKRCLASFGGMMSMLMLFYVITIYGPGIIQRMGASKAEVFYYLSALLFYTVFTTIGGGFLGDKIGRRWGIVLTITGASIGTFLIGQDLPRWGVIATALLLWGCVYASAPMAKCYMAEQFPTRLRGTGCTLGESITRFLGGAVLIYLFPILQANMPYWTLFALLALMGEAFIIPIWLWGFKTSGLSVEETGTDLSRYRDEPGLVQDVRKVSRRTA